MKKMYHFSLSLKTIQKKIARYEKNIKYKHIAAAAWKGSQVLLLSLLQQKKIIIMKFFVQQKKRQIFFK